MRALKKALALLVILCLLAQGLTGCGLFRKKDEASSGKVNRFVEDSDEEEEEEGSSHYGAPESTADVEKIALAVAQKEATKLLEGIDAETIKTYTTDEEIIDRALSFKTRLSSGNWETELYAIETEDLTRAHVGADAAEDVVYCLNIALNQVLGYAGSSEMATSSILRNITGDHAYNYPWETEDLPVYCVKTMIDGETALIITVSFGCYHTVTASVFPFLTSSFENVGVDLSTMLYDAYGASVAQNLGIYDAIEEAVDEGEIDEDLLDQVMNGGEEGKEAMEEILSTLSGEIEIHLPYPEKKEAANLSSEEVDELIESLVPASSCDRSLEELFEELEKQITSKANEDYLATLYQTQTTVAMCLECRIFEEEPVRTIQFTSEGLTVESLAQAAGTEGQLPSGLDQHRLQSFMSGMIPSQLNGYLGVEFVAAQSFMTASVAVSGLTEASALYWMVFEGEYHPTVLQINVVKNANDCYELTATPIYYSDRVQNTLKDLDSDTSTIVELFGALMDHS